MATTLGELVVQLGVDASALHSGLTEAGARFKKFGSELSDAGRNLSLTVTAPIVAVGVGAVKAAADWENAMILVAKTVDAPAAEIARLGEEFVALSNSIPTSANELARIGSLAAQLGIETDNIVDFTRTMADLGVTTNLSAEEAATALARLANVTQMPQDQFDRLGSTIVHLGNNLATTEAEIVDFGLRIAGAGEIAGLTEAEILAIGAAMSSVGVESEAGGTAVQKVLLAMTEQVNSGGEQLEIFARTAGVSAAEFARLFREDAAGAFALFVKGLGAQGQDAFATLEALDLQDQRLIRSFLSLAGAGDLLNNALAIGTEGWEKNVALTAEAEKFYGTLGNQFSVLKNQVMNTAAELGIALRPALEQLVDLAKPLIKLIGDMVERFKNLDPRLQAAIIAAAAFAAAIGPLLIVAGTLVTTVGALIPVVTAVAGAIAGVSAPVLAVVGVLGGLVTALVAAYAKSETFRDIVNGVFQEVKETVQPIMEEIQETVRAVMENMRLFWQEHGDTIMSIVTPAFQAIAAFLEGAMKMIGNFIELGLNIIQGDWSEAWENIKAGQEIANEALSKIFDALKTLLVNIVKAMWEAIKMQFSDAIGHIKNLVGKFKDEIVGQFRDLADIITFGSVWPDMWENIKGQTDEWTGQIEGIVNDWKGTLFGIFDDLSGGLLGKVTSLWDSIAQIFDEGGSFIDDLFGDLFGRGSRSGGSGGRGTDILGGPGAIGLGEMGKIVGESLIDAIVADTPAWAPSSGVNLVPGGLGTVAAEAAGGALALGLPLAVSFGGSKLADLLGRDPGISIEEMFTTGSARKRQDFDTAWRELLARDQTIYPGGFDPSQFVIEMDGYRVGRLVMKHGVDAARQQAGMETW